MSKREVFGEAVLYLGDALEVLPTLETCDLLLTDPPYGVAFEGRAGVHKKIKNDVKGYDVTPTLKLALKVLRRGRHVYVFGPAPSSDLPLCSQVSIIWDKKNFGLGDLSIPWGPQHEVITFAAYEISKANREKGFGALTARLRKGSVLRSLRPNSVRATRHPMEKPTDILVQMIESSTVQGEIVLDPFMGSGSTCVASLLSRRKSIGIEIDLKHFDVACKRVEAAEKALRLCEGL